MMRLMLSLLMPSSPRRFPPPWSAGNSTSAYLACGTAATHAERQPRPNVAVGGPFSRSREMDWNLIEGNWKQAQGKIKERWGKLTEDDLTKINGQREQLEGILQQRYGLAKDMVRKDIDAWLKS